MVKSRRTIFYFVRVCGDIKLNMRDKMTKLIAIIRGRELHDYESYSMIIESITDWSEVSDEDYQILKQHQYNGGDFTIIERIDSEEFISKTVEDYLKKARKLEAARLKKIKEKEKNKLQKELNKKASTEKAERQLLAELTAKYAS